MKLRTVLTNPLALLYTDGFIFRRLSKRRKHAWIACAPKSGSTWLTALLRDSLRWKIAEMVPGHDRREQEIDLRRLMLRWPTANVISPQQHCRCSTVTEDVVRRANIKVILQIRNIYDTVVSVRDHFENESVRVPMAYMDELSWTSLSPSEKLSFVVDMVVPWYFSFYCGWMTSPLLNTGRVHVSTYERLRENPVGALTDILAFLGETRGEDELRKSLAACERKKTRKNKGICGRGRSELTTQQMDTIRNYAGYYRGLDFSLLGISDDAAKAAA